MTTLTRLTDDTLAGAAAETVRMEIPDPSRPKGTRLRRVARFVRTALVVLLLLAGAAAGGNHLIRQRLAERTMVDAGTAVLTAEQIPVGTTGSGVLSEVLVDERDSVRDGQLLARVALTGEGDGESEILEVRAPTAGVVTGVLTPGAVARPGEPVATMYDPAKLVFTVHMKLETLRKLRLGMRAYVSGPGLPNRVTTTLASVKPKVDGLAGDGRLTVVLRPESAALATVRTLVPGLQFAVDVDTTTAPGGTPAVNSA